tara:strand:- start:98 stop:415 length:318 start_codon:yes stop_codon:yes gene_type:complete
MKLMTKAIKKQAEKQYDLGSDMEQKVVARYFGGDWTWYLMNLDPENSDYAWGIVKGFAVEMGSWQMSELKKVKFKPFNLPVERDLYFEQMKAKDVWDALNRGEHV